MRLRPVERRLAALGLALLALALAYLVLLHWWFVAPQLHVAERMRALRAQERRYSAIIAQRPALQARLARLAHSQATSEAFLPQGDSSTASADLMQRVVAVVAAQKGGGTCEVTQKMPVTGNGDGGRYPHVSVNISLRCRIQPLARVLYALENGQPDLFIGDFSALRNPVPQSGGGEPPLEVQFTLTGYLRPGSGGST